MLNINLVIILRCYFLLLTAKEMIEIDKSNRRPNGEIFQMFYRMRQLKMSELFDELTHMEFVTLCTLHRCTYELGEKKMKISDIARMTNVRSSAASRTLNSLEKRGLIVRIADKEDRRNTYVELTSDGLKVMEECRERMDDFMFAVFEKVGEEDMNRFMEILRKIHDVSQEELEKRSNSKK